MRKWIAALIATTTLGGGTLYGADQRINPYEDKETHYELAIKSDIAQGERVEIHKDKAQMDLIGWNGEYKISVIPQIPGPTFGADKKIDRSFKTAATRPLLSKKMEYRQGDVTAFIEPKEGTENEFDIDFTLHSKPDTNVFEYKIEGADDFYFFYQPPYDEQNLQPEDINAGIVTRTATTGYSANGDIVVQMPDRVVGSYALYHKRKTNNHPGQTPYSTGKIAHIYRPKAIDAENNTVLGELNYRNNLLTVTIPMSFLDSAAYPVTVDPTIGYTTAGATAFSFAADTLILSIINNTTDASGGTVSEVQAYAKKEAAGSSNKDSKAVIYASSTGALLNPQSGTTTINSDTAQWWVYSWTGPTLSASTGYLPGYYLDGCTTSPQTCTVYRDASTGQNTYVRNTGLTFPTLPDPHGATASTNRYSTYATYTASAGGATPSTPQNFIWFD